MSALTDLFTAFANKIRSKTGGSDTYTPPQMVNAIDDVYQAGVDAGTTPTQTKTVTAGTSATTVTPDTGYALSSVTVNPTPSQSKSATPTTSSQTITPDSGKLLSSVSVGAIQTETKSDTPNVSTNKTVSPSSGKYLSQVTIQPLTHSGTYTPAANTAQNDMGAYHDKRYVNTSGMIVPSGAKSITANGTGIDVSSYATANVNVPNPTLSGNATAADVKRGKTFYGSNYTKQTGTYDEPTINNITPSNSSPVSMSANNNYKPSANGYAISSYSDISPLASSAINLTADALYKPTTNGYAIKEYSACTPTADGSYHASGFVNMSRSGYSYSEKPTEQETTLWTNSSPTSSMGGSTVTLNSPLSSDYDAIRVYFRASTTAADSTYGQTSMEHFLITRNSGTQPIPSFVIGGYKWGGIWARYLYRVSDTQIYISTGRRVDNTDSNAANIIPTKIVGVKLPK